MAQNWKKILSVEGTVAAVAGAVKLALRNSRGISLRTKTLLISGGSRWLGLVLTREFAERGARVAICARSESELERVRQEFGGAGQSLLALLCDVGVRADVGRVVQTVRSQLGEIDVVVSNAGTILVGPRPE